MSYPELAISWRLVGDFGDYLAIGSLLSASGAVKEEARCTGVDNLNSTKAVKSFKKGSNGSLKGSEKAQRVGAFEIRLPLCYI